MKVKRKPLLVDRYLSAKHPKEHIPIKVQERVRGHLLEAKRFVLDDQAVRYLGELIHKAPEIVAKAQEFAIPPFPMTYVEMNARVLWESIMGPGSKSDPMSDTRLGYLYAGPTVYVLMESSGNYEGKLWNDDTSIMPFAYRLNQPFKDREEDEAIKTIGISRETFDQFFWGSSYDKLDDGLRRSLRANHSVKLFGGPALDSNRPTKTGKTPYETMFLGSAGDLKNIIATLLFLNQTSKIRYEGEVEPHRGMIGNKPSTFLRHTTITININPVERIRKFMGRQGSWRREHDVRGHYCRDKDARHAETVQCGLQGKPNHDWHEYGPNEWRCLKCNGHMWWRRACRRGSRDKGKVKSEYKVTA